MTSPALWAVTAYFNPLHYRRRRENFHVFRRGLGVPLLAVELSFDGSFELDDGDADIIVRLTGGDIMWQKERLLNLGIRQLPADCSKVACLDCDILFGNADWGTQTAELLEHSPMVQPFSRANYLDRDWLSGMNQRAATTFALPSVAFDVANGASLDAIMAPPGAHGRSNVLLGFAWAFRRELIERHGLYAACIAGGGDTALVCAAWGIPEAVVLRHAMNEHQAHCYRDWAQPFHAAVQGRIGCLEGDVFHLWHGKLEDRQALERHRIVRQLEFDPLHDITSDAGGGWRWNSDKPHLHAYLRQYFSARKEDG